MTKPRLPSIRDLIIISGPWSLKVKIKNYLLADRALLFAVGGFLTIEEPQVSLFGIIDWVLRKHKRFISLHL